MNLTDMLAMPLIQTQLARTLGTVVGFGLDGSTVTHYLAVDERTYAPEDAYPFHLVQVGSDALCTLACPVPPPAVRIPFRCAVYTQRGALLGYLDDVCVDKGGHIEYIVVGGVTLGAARLVAIDDIVVVRDKGAKGAPKEGATRRGPRKGAKAQAATTDTGATSSADTATTGAVSASAAETPTAQQTADMAEAAQEKTAEDIIDYAATNEQPPIEKNAANATALPQDGEGPVADGNKKPADEGEYVGADALRAGAEDGGLKRIISNYSFLLGRILGEDLVQEGRVVLPKGHTLGDADVAMAWQMGLLVPLTQLSRT